jgi:aspartokinase-like uncharacterized kinase
VIKVGGATCRDPDALDAAIDAIAMLAHRRLLLVPGGGDFADPVRRAQAALGLSEDAAHWMAILAMDQVATLIADRLPNAEIVHDAAGMAGAHAAGRIPVLAPHDWLRRADPLPHTWDHTSDSIAAWVAGAVGATTLILLKRRAGRVDELADAGFAFACPPGLEVRVATPSSLAATAND